MEFAGGRYVLESRLGEGAGGEVWAARDRLRPSVQLALKRVALSGRPDLVGLLRAEFQVLSSLDHPRLVRVHDMGMLRDARSDRQVLYYTRDLAPGGSLRVPDAGLDPERALGIALEVARALKPLHRAGLVHGDLKPGNIIVEPDGSTVRLIDFALCGTLRPGADMLPAGTLAYMSPEMLEGRVPDGRGDLYSLGIVLVEMLCGSPPLTGTAAQIVRGHLAGGVGLPPGWKGGGRWSRAIEAIVPKLTALEPAHRFPSVEEAEAALTLALGSRSEDPHGRRAPAGGLQGRARERDRAVEMLLDIWRKPLAAPPTVLVTSERGGGRTSFLRALRWELQTRDVSVVDLSPGRDVGASCQATSLARQILWLTRSCGIEADAALAAADSDTGAQPGRRLEAALASAASGLAATGPLAVLVDDLHRLDAGVSRLVRALAAACAGRPVAFVATSPEGEQGRLTLLGPGASSEIVLAPLSDDDVAFMVRTSLGRDDAKLVKRLRQIAGGNPAILAHWVERAALRGAGLEGAQDEPLPERLAGMWRDRIETVQGEDRNILDALCVHGQPARPQWLEAFWGDAGVQGAVARLEGAGLLDALSDGSVTLVPALAAALRQELPRSRRVKLHSRWESLLIESEAPEHMFLLHAALGGGARRAAGPAIDATARLRALGDVEGAERLLRAVLEGLDKGDPEASRARLALAQVLEESGRSAQALEELEAIPAGDPQTRLATARSLAGVGQREESVRRLEEILGDEASPRRIRMDAQRDLALAWIHLGRYEQAREAANTGLCEGSGAGDADRADLICSRGLACLYEERLEEASADLAQALALAVKARDGRIRVRAHWIQAMIHQRRGQLHEAAASYRQAIDICLRTQDSGGAATLQLNLATLLHRLGEFDEAIDRYLGAMDNARHIGRASQAVSARVNLGSLFATLGLAEQASVEAQRALAEATVLGDQGLVARAQGLVGESSRCAGRDDDAVAAWRTSFSIHSTLGNRWEQAEVCVELAALVADRGPEGVNEAEHLLEQASGLLDETVSALLEVRLDLARSALELARGRPDPAAESARSALAAARRMAPEWDDLSWRAFALMAKAHTAQGSDLLHARTIRRAAEAIEEAALKVPSRYLEAFNGAPARRWVREQAARIERAVDPESRRIGAHAVEGASGTVAWRDTLVRLMELNRRLATTRDPEALVEQLLDSAVEFTGAERGLLLLPGEGGTLGIASARDFYEGSVPDEHMAFSGSIAREVQRSGEPVITVSAMEDDRFGNSRSVHDLRLQSILCLPIKGRRSVIGVVYLENRLRRGKFSAHDRDILAAFSDQLAIAMETATLLGEAREQRRELERLQGEREKLLERRTRELTEARRDLRDARSRLSGKTVFRGLIGTTPAMRRVFSTIERMGESDVPVVVTGESGTGKEMVARAIHTGAARCKGPFVAVNCGAVPAALLESELFGHVKGAFTGAVRDRKGVFSQAAGGTLLLDEVGDMPARMQLDLLRVIQEGIVRPVGAEAEQRVDVRVIVASQQPLDRLVSEGRFREDLFYRLAVVTIKVPSLRERREDIPLLVDHFLTAFALRFRADRKTLARRGVKFLMEHPWPGNVRQLEHALLNAWVLAESNVLDLEDFETLGDALQPTAEPAPAGAAPRGEPVVSIDEDERHAIVEALRACRWNKTDAALRLGIPRRTFYRKLRKHGLMSGE